MKDKFFLGVCLSLAIASPAFAACTTSGVSPKFIFCGAGNTGLTVPADWNSCGNFIETYGAGGGSGGASGAGANGGGGGGGGAYASSSNVILTPGSSISLFVPSGGAAGSGHAANTWICNTNSNCGSLLGTSVVVGSDSGTSGSNNSGGIAGTAANSVGSVKFDGGVGASAV